LPANRVVADSGFPDLNCFSKRDLVVLPKAAKVEQGTTFVKLPGVTRGELLLEHCQPRSQVIPRQLFYLNSDMVVLASIIRDCTRRSKRNLPSAARSRPGNDSLASRRNIESRLTAMTGCSKRRWFSAGMHQEWMPQCQRATGTRQL